MILKYKTKGETDIYIILQQKSITINTVAKLVCGRKFFNDDIPGWSNDVTAKIRDIKLVSRRMKLK